MAVTVTNQRNPLASTIVQDTAVTSTLVANVTGATGTVYLVEIDNTMNAGVASYLKLIDNGSGTPGSIAANMVLGCPGGQTRAYVFTQGIPFSTAISYWATNAAAESTTTGPVSDITIRLVVG